MNASQGILLIDDPPGTIDPAIGARDFSQTKLGLECGKKLQGMRTTFYLERATIAGRAFRVDIIYQAEALDRVELYLHLWGDAEGWSGWSEQRERSRKEQAEAWAKDLFGREMEVKPFEMEGQEIVPFDVKWDTPRRLKFPWGEMVSYFDSKSAFAGVGIFYFPEEPRSKS